LESAGFAASGLASVFGASSPQAAGASSQLLLVFRVLGPGVGAHEPREEILLVACAPNPQITGGRRLLAVVFVLGRLGLKRNSCLVMFCFFGLVDRRIQRILLRIGHAMEK